MSHPRSAVHRTILVVDVESFGDQRRTNPHRLAVRDGLYRALREAFRAAGIPWSDCDREDRGDGVFILIPPAVGKSLLVDSLPYDLIAALSRHNNAHRPEERIRLRMALHAGEITYDEHGVAGASINLTFRLADAKPLKAALAASPGSLAVIVSSWFFDEVVRHTSGIDAGSYRPCRVVVKETATIGWISIPDHPYPAITQPRAPAWTPDQHERIHDAPRRGHALTVLQLSGLRLGRADYSAEALAALLWDDLQWITAEAEWAPDLVVVTGDLADNGRRSEYEQFVGLLRTLLEGLRLSTARVAIIPGDRDVNRAACRSYFAACESDETEPVPPYWPKWKHFERMFNSFYGSTAEFAVGQEWSLFVFQDLKTVVAGFNSTMAISHRPDEQHGYIDAAQVTWFDQRLDRYERKGWLRIGATYHDAELGQRLSMVLTTLGCATNEVLRYRLLRFDRNGVTLRSRVYRADQAGWADHEESAATARYWHAAEATFPPGSGPEIRPPGSGFKLLVDDAAEVRRIAELTELAESEAAKKRDRFITRVAEVAKLRYARFAGEPTVTEITPTDDCPGYLRVTCRDDAIVTQHPVGVCDGDIDIRDVELFVGRIHSSYAATDPQLISELVYGGRRASAEIIAHARRQGVRLVSFIEYEGLLDLRDYVAAQTSRLEQDPLYPPNLYLPQRFRHLGRGADRQGADLLAQVTDWLMADQARFVLLLGDFGRGKTFLLHELARTLPDRLPHVIPLFVELRHLEKSHSIDELVAAHLMATDVETFDKTMFRYMLRQGRIVLLFDGFDELALRITYERAADHLESLLEALDGQTKIVVTSRSQYFRSDQQVRTALGQRVEVLTASRIASVEDFTDDQIARFLTNFYGGDRTRAADRMALIHNIHDLLGLSRNPRMLGFIARIDDGRLREVQARTGSITSANLYHELLDTWLDHEANRASPPGAAPALTKKDRLDALTALAVRLWQGADQTISLSDLTETAGRVITALEAHGLEQNQAAHQIGSGTLLVRTGEDTFTFIHSSVMEYLVAVASADRLKARDDRSHDLLGLRPMSPLMADFFVGLAGHHPALRWTRETLAEPSASTAARTNAASIARIADPSVTRGAQLLNANLAGVNLSGLDLSEADLTGADLTDARLCDTTLRAARLRDVTLIRARIERTDLTDADLAGADLTDARLISSDLTGITVGASTWTRAALLGCRQSNDALDHPAPRAAAVTGRDAPTVVTPPAADVSCTAFSPNGSLVAYGSGSTLAIADARTGRLLQAYAEHLGAIWTLAFSPDGGTLATVSNDGTARLWDVTTGACRATLAGHTGPVVTLAFSPDSAILATGGNDGTARLWDTGTGTCQHVLNADATRIRAVAFSPDGVVVATGGNDGTARLWDTGTGSCRHVLTGHAGPILTLAFSPDGSTLATGGEDAAIRLWDTAGVSRHNLLGHTGPIVTLAFSPDGNTVATAGNDTTARLWDTGTGTCQHVLTGHAGPILTLAFSPDGSTLATGGKDDIVRLWGVSAGTCRQTLVGHTNLVWTLAFSPDGSTLATGSGDLSIRLWDTASGTCRQVLTNQIKMIWTVAYSPDGGTLAAGSDDNVIRIWDAVTGGCRHTLTDHSGPVWKLAFSFDGTVLASASRDHTVRLWDTATGTCRHVLADHTDRIRDVAFSPDGAILATGSDDNTARLWDTAAGTCQHVLADHTDRITVLAFSPNGAILATGSDDNTARLWDTATGTCRHTLTHTDRIRDVALSPNGAILATGSDDNTARLWDVASGTCRHTLTDHNGSVWKLAFSPNGTTLATGSDDNTARLWDVTTGTCRHTLAGHTGWIINVAFSPDGTTVATSGTDNTVRLWTTDTGELTATLLGLQAAGWAVIRPDGRYATSGRVVDEFWWAIKLCRFGTGELDNYVSSVRLGD